MTRLDSLRPGSSFDRLRLGRVAIQRPGPRPSESRAETAPAASVFALDRPAVAET